MTRGTSGLRAAPDIERAAAAVADALVAQLPREVAVAAWGRDVLRVDDFEEESRAVARAVPRRREEFLRGRACARAALGSLGGPARAIPVGPDREPAWPDGFVGSITHCGPIVLAAVARATDLVGIGVDVERAAPLEPGVRDQIMTDEERAGLDDAGRSEMPAVVFSAKETVHKALFPETRVWLDFRDVVLRLDASDGSFAVEPVTDLGRAVPVGELVGRWSVTAGHAVTSAIRVRS